MKRHIKVIIVFTLLSLQLYSQNTFKLVKVATFFPEWKELKKENIDWYHLSVPENYNKINGKKITLSVTVLHSVSGKSENPVIFIQGGPGGSSIGGLWRWLEHPARRNSDIILVDLRGTGLSEPTMCPELGRGFFEVLSKDQNSEKDATDKVRLSILCQQDLIDRGIDITSFNSLSVSKDLNCLKSSLKIDKWNVYGVSYGTFLAQEYAKNFPEDINSLILDSTIPKISDYYNKNSSNYLSSLNKLFQECKNDPHCNEKYPDLENIYFSVVRDLEKKPITVKVSRDILSSGKFTFNKEDFKIAIHQSLYQKGMIEILPLLIYQFHNRNEDVLSSLVATFAGALSLDYGSYYCYTCNEAIPNNSISKFAKDASLNDKLKDGLSFYKSDFDVCEQWNKRGAISLNSSSYLKNNNYRVLIFSGKFDPITPSLFASETSLNYNNSNIISYAAFGHCPSFTESGNEILANFLSKKQTLDSSKFRKKKVHFITNIYLDKAVYNFGIDIRNFDLLFFAPLILCVFILSSFIIYYYFKRRSKILIGFNVLILTTIILSLSSLCLLIYSVYVASEINFYQLAFGLPEQYRAVFYLLKFSSFLSLISVIYFFVLFTKVENIQYIILVLFSLLILNFYFFNWGFLF